MNQDAGEAGTAYRIRTGDLRLERAVSWASRRMRRRVRGLAATVRDHTNGALRAPSRGPGKPQSRFASRKPADRTRRPAGSSARRRRGRSASAPRTARTTRPATPPAAPTTRPAPGGRAPPPMTSFGMPTTGRGIDGHALQHLAPGEAALVRLLAEQVLDPGDVVERQVAMVALQLLRQRRPADDRAAVDVRHLADLVRPGRRPQVPRQLRREQDEARRSASARRPSARAGRPSRGRRARSTGPSRSRAATTSSM